MTGNRVNASIHFTSIFHFFAKTSQMMADFGLAEDFFALSQSGKKPLLHFPNSQDQSLGAGPDRNYVLNYLDRVSI